MCIPGRSKSRVLRGPQAAVLPPRPQATSSGRAASLAGPAHVAGDCQARTCTHMHVSGLAGAHTWLEATLSSWCSPQPSERCLQYLRVVASALCDRGRSRACCDGVCAANATRPRAAGGEAAAGPSAAASPAASLSKSLSEPFTSSSPCHAVCLILFHRRRSASSTIYTLCTS